MEMRKGLPHWLRAHGSSSSSQARYLQFTSTWRNNSPLRQSRKRRRKRRNKRWRVEKEQGSMPTTPCTPSGGQASQVLFPREESTYQLISHWIERALQWENYYSYFVNNDVEGLALMKGKSTNRRYTKKLETYRGSATCYFWKWRMLWQIIHWTETAKESFLVFRSHYSDTREKKEKYATLGCS